MHALRAPVDQVETQLAARHPDAGLGLDPATYRFLGTRHAVLRARTERVGSETVQVKVSMLLGWYAYLTQKIVDRPGQR